MATSRWILISLGFPTVELVPELPFWASGFTLSQNTLTVCLTRGLGSGRQYESPHLTLILSDATKAPPCHRPSSSIKASPYTSEPAAIACHGIKARRHPTPGRSSIISNQFRPPGRAYSGRRPASCSEPARPTDRDTVALGHAPAHQRIGAAEDQRARGPERRCTDTPTHRWTLRVSACDPTRVTLAAS